jgi:hypothetical protein
MHTIREIDLLLEEMNTKRIPNEKKKKQYGEVFTPLIVVQDMVNHLDEAYQSIHGHSIFSNPTLTWFDPAAGMGIFPLVVYQRLMKGLSIYPEESRRKHILEKMLFMSEIDTTNVNICKRIFCGDTYALNVYKGDTLSFTFFHSTFDVVMGNPPYNANGTKHKGSKNLYVKFVEKGFEWLKKDGYLLYLHPPVYRIPYHKIQHTGINLNEVYTTKQILSIRMFSIEQTFDLMHVMMNVDFILVKNSINDLKTETTLVDIQGKSYRKVIHPHEFIPNFGLDILSKIKKKTHTGTLDLILDSEMHAQKTMGTRYKNVHGIVSKGIKLYMSDKKHRFHDTPKLIINGIGSYNYVLYDKEGQYGLTQSPLGILNPDKNTVHLIQSSLFHYIANATKIIGNNFNKKASLFLPVLPKRLSLSNHENLYDYFEFTEEERMEINKTKIPIFKKIELLG